MCRLLLLTVLVGENRSVAFAEVSIHNLSES